MVLLLISLLVTFSSNCKFTFRRTDIDKGLHTFSIMNRLFLNLVKSFINLVLFKRGHKRRLSVHRRKWSPIMSFSSLCQVLWLKSSCLLQLVLSLCLGFFCCWPKMRMNKVCNSLISQYREPWLKTKAESSRNCKPKKGPHHRSITSIKGR